MQRINLFNRCVILFYALLILFLIMNVPHEEERATVTKTEQTVKK